MAPDCGHLLCELIAGGACSLSANRSRGCTPGLTSKTIAPEIFDEVRALLGIIDPDKRRDARVQTAAARLAEIIRREAREDRQLLVHVRDDEPELAPALERLCVRRHR